MARTDTHPAFEQARNELFSHILRCGVIEATVEHQKDWFDDTMDYLAERYIDLSDPQLQDLRTLGERYCRPIIKRVDSQESGSEQESESENEAVGAAS